ncbi:hypothetical protein CLOP_g19740 [Closterium sp. NIES-67]|nr:hypothetical protein CLOP_g19740 [Closterium sp. NIES-67]
MACLGWTGMGPHETALRLVSEAYRPPPDSPMNEFLCLSHVACDPLVGQSVCGPPPKLTVLLLGDDSSAKRAFLEWYTGESIFAAAPTKPSTSGSGSEPTIRAVTSGSWKDTLTGADAASAVPGVARALDLVPAARDLLSVHMCISKDRSLPCIDLVDLPLPQSVTSPIPPLSSSTSSSAKPPPPTSSSAPAAVAAAPAAALPEATAALGAAADVVIVFLSVAAVRAPSSRLASQLSLLLSPSNTQQQQQQQEQQAESSHGTPLSDRMHFVAIIPQSKASTEAAGTAAKIVEYLRTNVKELHSLSPDQVTLLQPPSTSFHSPASPVAAAAAGADGKGAEKEAGNGAGKEAGPYTFSFVEEILDKAVKAAVDQRVDQFERDVRRVKAVIDGKLLGFQQEQGEQRQRSKQVQRVLDTASSLLLPLVALLIPLLLSLIVSPPPLLRHLADIAAAKTSHPSSWEFPPYIPPQVASTITTGASLLVSEAHRFAATAATIASSVSLPPSLAPAADIRTQLAATALLLVAYLGLRGFASTLDLAPSSTAASDRSKLRVFQAFCDMALAFCGARHPY